MRKSIHTHKAERHPIYMLKKKKTIDDSRLIFEYRVNDHKGTPFYEHIYLTYDLKELLKSQLFSVCITIKEMRVLTGCSMVQSPSWAPSESFL